MPAHELETILILSANPGDQPQLRLDLEVREIQNGLRNSQKRFDVRHHPAARPIDLRRALLDHQPTYVHFCGHGAGVAGIVFEGQLVGAEALAGLFKLFSDRIRCVVLNACYSSIQAHAIGRHIDYVIGMRTEIEDAAAIEFSTAFYDAVGAGQSVEFAFELGCNAIQLAGIPAHLIPELLIRPSQSLAHRDIADDHPTEHLSHADWDGAPAVSLLYGREADAEVLKSWIIGEACRVVLITGLGGVGKTDLVTCLSRGGNRTAATSTTLGAGIHGHFDAVIWRSLLNAPPPDLLLADVLDFLSGHQQASQKGVYHQIERVLECLQDRRCLVILDNIEAVLNPGDPAVRYRPGYEIYGTFFEQVAKSNHQSCLLLTSREKPRAIADLEGTRKPVRSLALSGIGHVESQSLFAQIGSFSGTVVDWERVVALYNGNPLALELAARHIDQVFGGDLNAFLGSGRPVFADIGELLDWHLDRLSPAETELVHWLAIERDGISLARLSENLVSPISRANVTSNLQSLQRRIPLERPASSSFTLQPVLIEHVTARLINKIVIGLEAAMAALMPSSRQHNSSHDTAAALDMLNRYSLIRATASDHVRESQRRIILAPIAERIGATYGRALRSAIESMLDVWRNDAANGYAAGNILNLVGYLGVPTHGLDFSRLAIRQACLHEVSLHSANFSFSKFQDTTFRHPFGTIFSLSYSPNGQIIAVGDDNGEIFLFRTDNGQFEMRCLGHADVVSAVRFSPDGQTIASSSFDNTIRLWNARDGRCLNVLLGHRGWVYGLAFSPDGRILASTSEDGTCRLWDTQTGQPMPGRLDDSAFFAAVAFSPDGSTIAAAGSHHAVKLAHVPDLEDPVELTHHSGRLRAVAFSRQGDFLASAGEDREVSLWRPDDGSHIVALAGHGDSVTSLSFSAAGDILASASMDHTVRLWSTIRHECVGQLRVAPARVWAVECSPTERILATGSEDGVVRLWDIDTCECLTVLRGYSNKTWSLAFMPERFRLLAGNEDGIVRIWNVEDGRTTMEFHGHASRVWAVASSANGRWAASASDDLTVRLWDSRSGVCRHTLRGHTDWIRTVAFDRLDQVLVSAGEDGQVFTWDVATGRQIAQMESSMTRVFDVAFRNDGECLVAGGAENAIHLFGARNGRPLGELLGHDGWVSGIVPLDSDEQKFASCSEDGTVRLWNLLRRECTAVLMVNSKVWCGAYCNDGKSFVTGSDDGVLRRWNTETGHCEFESRAHQGAVWSLTIDAAADQVATAGNDGSIRIWRLTDLARDPSVGAIRPKRPYEGMNITGASGLTAAHREALFALGAVSLPTAS
ncbi:MAG: hypothetical protein JWM95_1609 [Gemmatimonadetes bacterium]|nr:hypothetical protein [Gemmatimonadota bacterium]